MDIYELLNKKFTNNQFKLSPHLFTETDKEELAGDDILLFEILRKISLLRVEFHDSEIKFHPMFTSGDSQKPFSVEDMTDDDYETLKKIDFERLPIGVRALIADFLWTQKKEFKASQTAAEAYWDLFQLRYAEKNNTETIDMIRRAVNISVQTKQQSLYSSICGWFSDYLIHNAADDDGFFAIHLMELFVGLKDYDVSLCLPVLDSIISLNSNNVLKVEMAYKLKSRCFHKLKNEEDATRNNISLAKHYVDFAEKIMQQGIQGIMRAEYFFREAIKLFRNNGESQQAERTHKRLVEIQKEIPQNMVSFPIELDIKGIVDNIEINMDGLTFEESVIRLAQMVNFDKYETIKGRVLDEYNKFSLSHLFGINVINAQGQTVLSLPPLDIEDPESNQELLESYMYRAMLKKQEHIGNILLKNALNVVRNKFEIKNSMLDFLVKDNPIIPEGRERIFQSAIGMFLRGDYYEAIHILAPQTENLFRNIVREVGGLTVTLDNDGSSAEKVLSSIFNLPEMLECYDNDILFNFKGLLNEQAGANIRNEVAHGIIGEAACSSGVCIYFGVAVIKLLAYISVPCFDIFKKSEKLKHYEPVKKDALKIIKKGRNLK